VNTLVDILEGVTYDEIEKNGQEGCFVLISLRAV
jgi:hypothetical protein